MFSRRLPGKNLHGFHMGVDLRNIAVCVLVTLGAILVAWPFAEAGYIDDFSYIHMAKTLADTGRFAYNGWPTAMLGIQVWWGAAWILLFGFSFTLVRLSVLPLSLGAVVLVYLLARRASLSPNDSLFVSLLTSLSTLFLPLAPTFMSDIPAFFFLLACLYGFSRAADAGDQVPVHGSRVLAWLAIGTLCGVVGGTIRQPVWFAPVVASTVLMLRPSSGVRLRMAAAVCGVIGMTALVVGATWFARQPYAIPTRLPSFDATVAVRAATVARAFVKVSHEVGLKLLPAVLFCLPWIVEQVRIGWRARWGRWVAVGTGVVCVVVMAGTLSRSCERPLRLLGGSWAPTGHTLHDVGIGLIRCGVLGLLVALAVALIVAIGRARSRPGGSGRFPPAVVLPLAYLLPYGCSLLLVSWTTAGIYPRYYLPFLPALGSLLLFATRGTAADRESGGDRRSAIGWLLVAFFALRGIAILHDEFTDTRTRLAAIAFLERQGVPRERITSKWVIDGWEQIERGGSINDPKIRVPANAYVANGPNDYPDPLFRDRFPALRPNFMVVDDREETPGDSASFPRFPFTVWWRPPYRREIVIRTQQLPDDPIDTMR